MMQECGHELPAMQLRLALPLPLLFALVPACDTPEDPMAADEPVGSAAGKADGAGDQGEAPPSPFGMMAVQCWDSSFAYNVLTAFEEEDGWTVQVQGASLNVVDLLDDLEGFSQPTLSMEFDVDECERSEDGTLLSCHAFDKPATVTRPFEEPHTVEGAFELVTLELSRVTRTTVQGVFDGHEVAMTTRNEDFEVRTTRFFIPGFGGQFGCNYDPTTFQF